jgi:hypothetical protein
MRYSRMQTDAFVLWRTASTDSVASWGAQVSLRGLGRLQKTSSIKQLALGRRRRKPGHPFSS